MTTPFRSDHGLIRAALAADDRRRRLEVEAQPADGETPTQASVRTLYRDYRLNRWQQRKRGRP